MIWKTRTNSIGYMMVSADSDTVALFNNGDSNFVVENYMTGNSDSFRITNFSLNVCIFSLVSSSAYTTSSRLSSLLAFSLKANFSSDDKDLALLDTGYPLSII